MNYKNSILHWKASGTWAQNQDHKQGNTKIPSFEGLSPGTTPIVNSVQSGDRNQTTNLNRNLI